MLYEIMFKIGVMCAVSGLLIAIYDWRNRK